MAKYKGDVKKAEAALAAWKKQNRFKSLIYENTNLQARIVEARQTFDTHRQAAGTAPKALAGVLQQKEAAWPALRQRASEDVQEIAAPLSREQAWMLIQDFYSFDREGARGVRST